MLNDLLSALRGRQTWLICALGVTDNQDTVYHNNTYTMTRPPRAEDFPALREKVAENMGLDPSKVVILNMMRLSR